LHTLFSNARFRALLLEVDWQIAAEVQQKGCACCDGALHASHYMRKPRGGPPLPPEHDLRLSFCCAVDGCRKRHTPPSLRFLGRRVYWATVNVIASVLRHGSTPTRVWRLQELIGATRRTIERWCAWWRNNFVETRPWRSAAFVPTIASVDLPRSLLERFGGDCENQLLALLRFLKPITGGTNWARLTEGA